MSEYHRGFTKDPLYKNLNMDFEDNNNFFSGIEIEITKEDESEDNEELKEDIEGLESLIKSFPNYQSNNFNGELIDGNEGLISGAKSLIKSLWEFIKDIFRWIGSLFTNKLARVDAKVKMTIQRRKINGIKDGKTIKYPRSVYMLAIPAKITNGSDWVANCVKYDIDFYKKVIDLTKELRKVIHNEIVDLDKSKFEVMSLIGRKLTNKTLKENDEVKTDILAGNRVYTVLAPNKENPNIALTYFSESNTNVTLKEETYVVNASLIDECIKVLEEYQDLIEDTQSDMNTLQREFEKECENLSKQDTITKEQKTYLAWLCNVHKRLVNTTLQHAIQVINALDEFINLGLN